MKEKLLILSLEDSRDETERIREILAHAGLAPEVIRVNTREDFLTALNGDRIDIILAEYSLPNFDGLSALELALERCPEVPFIFVTGALGEEVAVDALKKGAADYVLKEKLASLVAAVHRALEQRKEKLERRRAEASLRLNEEKYRRFIEDAPVGMLTINIRGEFTYANKKLAAMTGYSPGDWLKKSFRTLVYPEDLPVVLERIQKRISGQRAADPYEIRLFHASGKIIWARISAESIYEADQDGHKRLVGVQAFVEDITERKTAEQALQKSEERFRVAFHTSPDAININRLEDGLYVDINEGFSELTGYTREEVLGKTSLELTIWDDPRDREELVRGLKQNGQVNNLEAKFRMKDGRIVLGLMSAKVMMIDAVPHILSLTRDIEKLKRAEAEVRRVHEFNQTLLDTVDVMIVVVDNRGRILRFNAACERLTGWRADEVVGRYVLDFLIPAEQRSGVRAAFENLTAGRFPNQYENDWLARDGSRRWIAWANAALLNAEGQVEFVLCTGIDLTERKKMEAQLRQSQKMEAIGTLAGGIAHDFNNILAAIIGYTQLALYDLPEGSKLKPNLDQVLRASDRARDLVKQILNFSRQSEQAMAPLHLLPVVKEALKLLRSSLPTSIEIKLNPAAKEDLILGDPIQIHQVLMNLGTNAAQAIKGGKGLIEFGLEEVVLPAGDLFAFTELSPGPYIRMTIRDTGEGIDPTILNRIFDPFFTTKRPGEGTGMGLSVVHGIIKRHGGEIKVTSEPGQGSVFRVYLPRIDWTLVSEGKAEGAPPTGSERILFVDDEPGLLGSWVRLLEHWGYTVVGQESSLAALEAFRAGPDRFDLVITDQTMPRMNGADLARELLTLRPDLPIILCSGFSETMTPETATAIGIRKFLLKPIVPLKLALSIRSVLEGKDG